jgi:uncharacterized protein with NAD-binding domain and iron-sulfur cluster
MPAKKIAILGGGISALTTALELSAEPDWKDRYEITIYQMGWRLGGKGASSRNEVSDNRIEEHGLHIWLGFYDNAFALIQKCYEELARPESDPLAAWTDAFKPHSYLVLEERVNDAWSHWPLNFPTNDKVPGDGADMPSVWEFIVMVIQWLENHFKSELAETFAALPDHGVGPPPPWWGSLLSSWGAGLEFTGLTFGEKALKLAKRKASSMSNNPADHTAQDQQMLHWLIQRFAIWLHARRPAVEDHARLRHAFIMTDLAATITRGCLADGVIYHGLEALDQFEFRAWLKKHGAADITIDSALVRGGYDLAFSFVDGDPTKPNIAAGAALRGGFRTVFAYKGAILWKMQAGMGETVFTPIYEVLKRRGVTVEFFHRVDALHLSPAANAIESVTITRQATPVSDYNPLIPVNGYQCWPAHPNYDQLVEGDELQESGVNLESFWSPWQGVEQLTLHQGEDFDLVVLGISLAALPGICSELLEMSSRWKAMCDNVKTVQTQGFQVWLNKDLEQVGWSSESPILGGYVEPLDTWADMTHLLPAEGWQDPDRPTQLAYFVGVMADAQPIPGPEDTDFPRREYERTRTAAVEYLNTSAPYLWPETELPDPQEPFDWQVLSAPEGIVGDERFAYQYWRPNIDPTERYVLAVAGSTQYRLRTDQSGFSNLYLAGDWIRNGFDTPGCIESAVISGRQAARVISGESYKIVGESDF